MKELLEKIKACVATINAAPGKVWECDGEDIVGDPQIVYGKRCSHPICVIDLETQDGYDPETGETPEDSERIAAAIIEGHNIAPALLSDAITEITALRARVEALEALVEGVARGFITYGGYEWDNTAENWWTTGIGPVVYRNMRNGKFGFWSAYNRSTFVGEFFSVLEAMQAAIDAAKEAEGA